MPTPILEFISKCTNLEELFISIPPCYSGTNSDPTPFRIRKGMIPDTVRELKLEYEGGGLDVSSNFLTNLLEPGSIPSSVTILEIDHRYFRHDPINLIPPSVTDLKLDDLTLQQVNFEKGMLPNGLNRLAFGNIKISLSPGSIPESVRELKINRYHAGTGKRFKPKNNEINVPLTIGMIPHGVKKLEFGPYFVHHHFETNVIPSKVTEIVFSGAGSLLLLPSDQISNYH
eukprot:gene8268-10159_t